MGRLSRNLRGGGRAGADADRVGNALVRDIRPSPRGGGQRDGSTALLVRASHQEAIPAARRHEGGS
jgi:hypothetical protein